ncbi:hypothetical protein EGR_07138 [Echinococcus granulosus]|uniref:Uncharacterized protein n=1 Tax=Echinococcus granulosus TaxID=6210 RepID=W6UIT2_ECHGR|nr:hypothetical protein EGR_07138 [Echinococcus granulosus]EUB58032.1 hypothetical protein EGR_07138 [Echinococcus granulosus]
MISQFIVTVPVLQNSSTIYNIMSSFNSTIWYYFQYSNMSNSHSSLWQSTSIVCLGHANAIKDDVQINYYASFYLAKISELKWYFHIPFSLNSGAYKTCIF